METFSGKSIEGKKVLEIGPGQTKPFYYALGPRNDYIAIDLEIAPDGLSFRELLRVFRENGVLRAIKSLGRQVLGIDRKLGNALRTEFGGAPIGAFVQGDASKTDFDDDTFDYVMSTSVFEHLQDPAAVMNEIARTLKPGGTVFTATHIYTSITGAHDPRLFVDIEALPPWAHLDPDHQSKVEPNSYLNRLRISDYLGLFEESWPGGNHRTVGGMHEKKRALMGQLPRSVSDEYSEQELLSDVIISLWTKPMNDQ
jgi:SAM-dependent methyltransferase